MILVAAALLLAETLRMAIPLALAAAGGSISERSGIINIALEGMLLIGAFGYVVGAHAMAALTGDSGLGGHLACAGAGLLGALLAGLFLATIHALATIRFRADQVVSGVAVNLLAFGLSKFLLQLLYGTSSNSPEVVGLPELPLLSRIPTVGVALGAPLLWIAAGCVVAAQLALFRTVWGLRVRATGEHPSAAESAGISVAAVRVRAVLVSGVLAALGGAWLAADQRHFTEGMSAGQGYIALAAVIVGNWRPGYAAGACLFFAVAEGVQIQLQGTSVPIPGQLLQVLPHILALVVLAGGVGRSVPPAALGRPFPE